MANRLEAAFKNIDAAYEAYEQLWDEVALAITPLKDTEAEQSFEVQATIDGDVLHTVQVRCLKVEGMTDTAYIFEALTPEEIARRQERAGNFRYHRRGDPTFFLQDCLIRRLAPEFLSRGINFEKVEYRTPNGTYSTGSIHHLLEQKGEKSRPMSGIILTSANQQTAS